MSVNVAATGGRTVTMLGESGAGRGAQLLEADAFEDRRHEDVDPGAGLLDRRDLGVDVDLVVVAGRRRLREHHDRLGAGVPGEDGAALDATRLHRPVEPADEQHRVDVGGDGLLGVGPGGTAAQEGGAGEDGDGPAAGAGEPVADGGGRVEAAVEGRGDHAVRGGEQEGRAVVTDDACGGAVGMFGEQGDPAVTPPVRGERGRVHRGLLIAR